VLVLDDAQNYPGPALEELRLRLSAQRALFTLISDAVQFAALPREEIAPAATDGATTSTPSRPKKGLSSIILILRHFECVLFRCRGKREWNMKGRCIT